MFIRKKKNQSEVISVQIIEKRKGNFRDNLKTQVYRNVI